MSQKRFFASDNGFTCNIILLWSWTQKGGFAELLPMITLWVQFGLDWVMERETRILQGFYTDTCYLLQPWLKTKSIGQDHCTHFF